MSQEEKYKLALFAVVRNSKVMPQSVKLGKTMHEINTMAVAVEIPGRSYLVSYVAGI